MQRKVISSDLWAARMDYKVGGEGKKVNEL